MIQFSWPKRNRPIHEPYTHSRRSRRRAITSLIFLARSRALSQTDANPSCQNTPPPGLLTGSRSPTGLPQNKTAATSSLPGKMMLPGRSQRAQAGDPVLCHSDPLIQAGPGGSLSHCPADPRSQGGWPRHIRPQAARGNTDHSMRSAGDWATRMSPGSPLVPG